MGTYVVYPRDIERQSRYRRIMHTRADDEIASKRACPKLMRNNNIAHVENRAPTIVC
jgi:hypothetical protein